jgi:hypothetical protein
MLRWRDPLFLIDRFNADGCMAKLSRKRRQRIATSRMKARTVRADHEERKCLVCECKNSLPNAGEPLAGV